MDKRSFDERLTGMREHERRMAATVSRSQAEARTAQSRADALEKRNTDLEQRVTRAAVREPLTYRRGGEHSFFWDIARSVRRSDPRARDRVERHGREMEAEYGRRAESRARAAQSAYEEMFYSTPADRRAVDAMLAAGANPFERRALTRTDGNGGYFAPPAYLVDQYAEYARAGSPFAALWNSMPLPLGTSEVNVPRMALGAATGPQGDAAPAPTRDISDTLVSAPVRTIAGYADASIQWLEQGQGSGGYGVDDVIYADLTADLHQNTDGQLLLGSGAGNQLLGVWPAGAITAAGGIVVADTSTTASQTWTTASAGAPLHTYAAQTVSQLATIRARPPQYWIWHPWTWSLYAAQVDAQGRPLVNSQHGGLPPGVAGYYQNIPVVTDANVPTTFGGSILAPSIGPITNGQYAALPGTGTGASYTPLLLARTSDLYLYAGEIRLQVLREVLSGSGQARFQAFQYLAAMPNRYVAAAAAGSVVSAGGNVAHATLTWQETQSLLIKAGSGF